METVMKSKALRTTLALLLVFALLPVQSFTSNRAFASGTDEDTSDAGANSFRITDGVPNNVLLAQREEGIQLFGAYSDVGDEYRAAWTPSNGIDSYTYRKKPSQKGTVIKIDDVLELGVDVSYYNNEKGGKYSAIDWEKVKADGISFVIVRAADAGTTGKGFKDPWFVENIQGAYKAGLKVGVYIYSRAVKLTGSTFSVDNEIRLVKEQIEAAGFGPEEITMPIYLDFEDDTQLKKLHALNTNGTKTKSKTMLANIAKKFFEAFQTEGYHVGVYAGKDWFDNELGTTFSAAKMAENGWSRWVPRYAWGAKSTNVESTDIWQFTSIGKVNGMPNKYCDMNFAFTTYGKAPVYYHVSYKLNGGKNNSANPKLYFGTVKLKNPTRTSYKFEGWYADPEMTHKVTKVAKSDYTLYAKWSQPYKITYKLKGGKNNPDNLKKYGATFTLKSPTRTGYVFKGWYSDSKYKKRVYKLTNKNATVYAKWQKAHKITYKLHGGVNNSKNPSWYVGKLKLKNPTREGYRFKGWYSNSAMTKRVRTLAVTSHKTVYAKWKKK